MAARAEKACATARQDGGNRVAIWVPQNERSDDSLREVIAHALASDAFVLLFQPIVALGNNVDAHYEAQLRLRAPDGELLPPREIFPVAARHGLMTAIDRWVMEHVLDLLHDHRIRHPGLRLLVHQTLATVCSKEWVAWFREQLHGRDLARIRPVMQFQMRDVRGSLKLAKVLFAMLDKAGIQTCIANVTGSAADLDLLGGLDASMAKLAFHTLANSSIDELTELVGRLHRQNVLVIAAGIEDQSTVTRVWSCRADFIQGNYIQIAREDISFEIPAHHGI
jgi:EAL domain-containing protein (putative c-di-GMP-specific phosphodiesterase class I)